MKTDALFHNCKRNRIAEKREQKRKERKIKINAARNIVAAFERATDDNVARLVAALLSAADFALDIAATLNVASFASHVSIVVVTKTPVVVETAFGRLGANASIERIGIVENVGDFVSIVVARIAVGVVRTVAAFVVHCMVWARCCRLAAMQHFPKLPVATGTRLFLRSPVRPLQIVDPIAIQFQFVAVILFAVA